MIQGFFTAPSRWHTPFTKGSGRRLRTMAAGLVVPICGVTIVPEPPSNTLPTRLAAGTAASGIGG